MKREKVFMVPGIYHDLKVVQTTRKAVGKWAEDPKAIAAYDHYNGEIRITKDLSEQVKRHSFYHELGHHVRDTLKSVAKEEDKCDLLGAYLMRLADAREEIEKNLEER
jgi:Zn-dependent peptidase ImmA (M78 family)